MKRVMKAVAAVMLLMAVVLAAGCHKDPENGGGNDGGNGGGGTEAGLYLGVIGFNDQLITKPIGLLNSSSEQSFTFFINALTTRDGTALYHAVNTSLDWLKNATMPEDLMNVSIVTFTDGLDNASMMLNDQYGSQTEFLNAINHRIKTEKVEGLDIQAYAVGMRGNDVQDVASFQRNLQQLSSSPSNVFEVENMDLVTVKFREIATKLYNETTVFLGTGVKIPGGYDNNTMLRITFDNVNDANSSTKYVEGFYSRENGKGKLTNVNYCGLHSTSGATVVSDRQDGAYFWFTFRELKTLDGVPVTNTSNMKLWRCVANTADWQPESEFSPSSYSEIQVDSKSAVIVLVLDCTTSLGPSDFNQMKNAAKTFVEVLGHYGNNGGGVIGNVPSVITSDASEVTAHSAVCGGTIINDGGSAIISRGVCWSLHETPTSDDQLVLDGNMNGEQFLCQLSGLESATTYYFRPFAMNGAGVGYGEQRSFTTETFDPIPPVGRVYTIDEILELQPGTVFQESSCVDGIVTADEVSGNLYKSAYFQDRSTGKAIQLYFNNSSTVRIGDSIRVYLEGSMFVNYHELPQLSNINPDGQVVTLASNRPIEPAQATIAGLRAGAFPPGSLVRLENVMFTEHTTFADLGYASYGNRTIVEVDNPNISNSVVVRTSNYAYFAGDTLPNRACNIVAVASVYNDNWQLILRTKDDIEEFGDPLPVNGEGGTVHSLPYLQSFYSDFGSYMTYDVLGPQSWMIDYNTAKINGYSFNTYYSNEDWLISSPVRLTGVNDAKMTVTYIARYFNSIDADLTFWASTNYIWGTDPTTATWTQLPVSLINGTNWDFQTAEIPLTEFVGRTVTVAAKYLSSDTTAGLVEIQRIEIEEGSVVTPTPSTPEVQNLPYAQSFAYEFGTYMTYDVLGSQSWVIDYSTAKMTGYLNPNYYPNEDWLISSPVAITGVSDAKMVMTYVGRYFEDINEDVTIWVSSNYTWGTDPTTTTWTQLPASLINGTNWSDFHTAEIPLTEFVGETIYIGVKYTSSDTKAGTMEIQSIVIE